MSDGETVPKRDVGRVILVVEDDPTFARILEDCVAERGFAPMSAARGDTGLVMARQYKPDAIMLDVRLPGVDGWALLDQLKHDPATRHIPIIALTAHALASDREKAMEVGCDGYLAKPCEPRAVVAAVEPSRPLIELQAELERMMQRMGLDPEGRKFTPHVTLARLHDASSQDVADYLSVRGYFPSRTFMASRFVLFSSRASTGGGPYVVEDSYALSA